MVRLKCEVLSDPATLIIESQGMSIPSPILPKFFDVFSISEVCTPGGDLGLGPAVAARILSLFGASVSVSNRHPSGIRITVSLKFGKRMAVVTQGEAVSVS
jgi:C4-dicarboxylate-specific signal transduction histidine kinase